MNSRTPAQIPDQPPFSDRLYFVGCTGYTKTIEPVASYKEDNLHCGRVSMLLAIEQRSLPRLALIRAPADTNALRLAYTKRVVLGGRGARSVHVWAEDVPAVDAELVRLGLGSAPVYLVAPLSAWAEVRRAVDWPRQRVCRLLCGQPSRRQIVEPDIAAPWQDNFLSGSALDQRLVGLCLETGDAVANYIKVLRLLEAEPWLAGFGFAPSGADYEPDEEDDSVVVTRLTCLELLRRVRQPYFVRQQRSRQEYVPAPWAGALRRFNEAIDKFERQLCLWVVRALEQETGQECGLDVKRLLVALVLALDD